MDKRTLEMAHKIAYVSMVYPEKKMSDVDSLTGIDNGIAGLFETVPIEFNAGAWAAQDLDLIAVAEDGVVTHKKSISEVDWKFGELVDHLMAEMPYCIKKINEKEADIEDEFIGSQWTAGFPAQDVVIAMKRLIETGVVASYDVTNETVIKPNREQRRKGAKEEIVMDTYTFYTLPENLEKRWGEKQFEDQSRLRQLQKGQA